MRFDKIRIKKMAPEAVLPTRAHPDDAEIGTGAFLLKMKKRGHRTGILCLTEGDMGNGTPEQRRKEAAEAAAGLKVDAFEILNLGDTRLEDSFENRVTVASLIRKYRPAVVLTSYFGLEPGRGRGHADRQRRHDRDREEQGQVGRLAHVEHTTDLRDEGARLEDVGPQVDVLARRSVLVLQRTVQRVAHDAERDPVQHDRRDDHDRGDPRGGHGGDGERGDPPPGAAIVR